MMGVMANGRGGAQRIPRPENVRIGNPAPWADLSVDDLKFSLDEVRSILALPRELVVPEHRADARPAAVLIALFENADDGEARVVLTKRPETMPSHRGEIAFPGGKHDPALDASLAATALREAHEEVALDPSAVEIVAELDGIGTIASQFVITPFVGLLHTRPDLVPHPREVVSVFDVSLSELLSVETHRSEIWPLTTTELDIQFYDLVGETVWGATARILTNLFRVLTAPRVEQRQSQ